MNCSFWCWQEDLVSEEIEIDHRIHSRLIGFHGRGIRKIMENFKVDVRFPGRESDNPDLVVITGQEDNVLECKDDLLNRAEELVRMSRQCYSQLHICSHDHHHYHYITSPLHHISSFQMPLAPKVTSGASTITCYTKYHHRLKKSFETHPSVAVSQWSIGSSSSSSFILKISLFFHAKLRVWRLPHIKSLHISLNIAHSSCNYMSSIIHSPKVFLPLPSHFTPTTSISLQDDTQSSTALTLKMFWTISICHTTSATHPEDCTDLHCAFYPSPTPHHHQIIPRTFFSILSEPINGVLVTDAGDIRQRDRRPVPASTTTFDRQRTDGEPGCWRFHRCRCALVGSKHGQSGWLPRSAISSSSTYQPDQMGPHSVW